MRRVRISKTFIAQLNELVEQGFPRFGTRVVTEKRELVFKTITDYLAQYPRRPQHPILRLCVYPVSKTPFKLLYDFDDAELRVHFIVHKNASLDDLDPTSAVW
jgi:hypothetical protein